MTYLVSLQSWFHWISLVGLSTTSMVKQVQFSPADGTVQLTSQSCIMLLVLQWETFFVVSKRSTILCCLCLSQLLKYFMKKCSKISQLKSVFLLISEAFRFTLTYSLPLPVFVKSTWVENFTRYYKFRCLIKKRFSIIVIL
jgi:hypothetical protein